MKEDVDVNGNGVLGEGVGLGDANGIGVAGIPNNDFERFSSCSSESASELFSGAVDGAVDGLAGVAGAAGVHGTTGVAGLWMISVVEVWCRYAGRLFSRYALSDPFFWGGV